MCAWDATGYEDLTYDKTEKRYYNNGKPELKADFVEPGQGKNAAYKWTVAKDGTIQITGEYVKFANSADPDANGTAVRIFLNGKEKEFYGATGNYAEEKVIPIDKTFEVKAGDVILFAVNPEGNDAYDGGRLTITIKEQ